MVRKASAVLSKPLFAVVALALVIFALVFVYIQISKLQANPCWKNVLSGLEPLKTGVTAASPELRFDGDCLEKFVITSSKGVCSMECRNIDDTDQQRDCLKKCDYGEENDAYTFIIAVPDNEGFFKRVGTAMADRDFFWVFNGRVEVFTFDCQAGSIDPGMKNECGESGPPWECKPISAPTSYKLDIDESQKVCDVKVKAS